MSKMRDLKIFTKNIEQEAISQIELLLSQEAFKDCKVRIMPDVHAGKGCVIGFTADLGEKVIPNIVGVDIGCGMLTVKLKNKDFDLHKLDNVIHRYVPSGRNIHDSIIARFDKLKELKCYSNLKDIDRIEKSIGTLGGGNHFIEIDTDRENNKYLIIHTGSRNLGKQVADYYQKLAIEAIKGKYSLEQAQKLLIEEYKNNGMENKISSAIKELRNSYKTLDIPNELCYLTLENRENYLHDMKICQEYASLNRKTISKIIINKMGFDEENRFETIHNYIEHETNIVRKGAISAKKGEILLIPINMRDGCLLGVGRGNKNWNESAPHGAGRIMSRSMARKQIKIDDYKHSMENIYTTSVNEQTLDEAPMVYKNIKEIINNTKRTIDIIDVIKPIYNFKAND